MCTIVCILLLKIRFNFLLFSVVLVIGRYCAVVRENSCTSVIGGTLNPLPQGENPCHYGGAYICSNLVKR